MTVPAQARRPASIAFGGFRLEATVALVAGVAAAAAVLYVWRLGSSSWFVDEASSANIAGAGAGFFLHQLHFVEQNPPGYFGLLTLWSHVLGTAAEAWLRLPSALAATLLVAAVARLGYLTAGRPAAIVAAILAVVSPFNLEYAQQARPYALLMLLSTMTAIAALEASRRRSRRWLGAATVLAAATLWVHYFALLVVAPLMVWLARQPRLSRRDRTLACAGVGLAWLASVPLAYLQYRHKPAGSIGAAGNLSLSHIASVIGAPFDGRYGNGPGTLQAIGALIVIAAVAIVVRSTAGIPGRGLVLSLTIVPAVALFLLDLGGRDVMISRYYAAAAPFAIVAIAAAVARAGPGGAALLTAAIVVAVVALVRSELPSSNYPPTRQAMAVIAAGWHRGDVIDDATGNFAVQYTLQYYADHMLRRPIVVAVGGPLSQRTRIWLIAAGRFPAVPPRFNVAEVRHFQGDLPLQSELLVPDAAS